jgi:hypothetical protein
MKLRHLPILLLALPTFVLADGWAKDPITGCEFMIDFADSASWDGACVGGKASGNGTITEKIAGKISSTYKGEVVDGKPNGQGIVVYSGYRYEGQFKDGKPNGQGVRIWYDGSRYEGAWKDNRESGLGKETAADGSLIYEGQWENGKRVTAAPAPAPAPAPASSEQKVYWDCNIHFSSQRWDMVAYSGDVKNEVSATRGSEAESKALYEGFNTNKHGLLTSKGIHVCARGSKTENGEPCYYAIDSASCRKQ